MARIIGFSMIAGSIVMFLLMILLGFISLSMSLGPGLGFSGGTCDSTCETIWSGAGLSLWACFLLYRTGAALVVVRKMIQMITNDFIIEKLKIVFFVKIQGESFRDYGMKTAIERGFHAAMGDESDDIVRRGAIAFAIFGFLTHLALWALHNSGRIEILGDSVELVQSPLSALYTPFSILLVYEVYQLIRTIPDSFSSSVGKQYEIATLLVVRDILKRLSEVSNSQGWEINDDVGFLLVECAAFIALFYTSLTYQKISTKSDDDEILSDDVTTFITTKMAVANVMLIVFIAIADSLLISWIGAVQDGGGSVDRAIFFLDFFTFLILADILILLISYWFYTDFGNLARNTGFVLSTVIIRVAISSEGVSSMILFTLSGVLGIAILRMFSRGAIVRL